MVKTLLWLKGYLENRRKYLNDHREDASSGSVKQLRRTEDTQNIDHWASGYHMLRFARRIVQN